MEDPADDEELATLTRVRNRLAQTPDFKLTRVLANLLPRLLARLDGSTASGAAVLRPVPISHQEMILGTLAHARERVRAMYSIGDDALWIRNLVVAAAAATANNRCTSSSPVAVTSALSLVEVALPKVTRNTKSAHEDVGACLAPLIVFLDTTQIWNSSAHHDDDDAGDAAAPSSSSSSTALFRQSHVRMASWALLDAVSVLSGVRLLLDWQRMEEDLHAAWDQLEAAGWGHRPRSGRRRPNTEAVCWTCCWMLPSFGLPTRTPTPLTWVYRWTERSG
jgi:hypothetical protein